MRQPGGTWWLYMFLILPSLSWGSWKSSKSFWGCTKNRKPWYGRNRDVNTSMDVDGSWPSLSKAHRCGCGISAAVEWPNSKWWAKWRLWPVRQWPPPRLARLRRREAYKPRPVELIGHDVLKRREGKNWTILVLKYGSFMIIHSECFCHFFHVCPVGFDLLAVGSVWFLQPRHSATCKKQQPWRQTPQESRGGGI